MSARGTYRGYAVQVRTIVTPTGRRRQWEGHGHGRFVIAGSRAGLRSTLTRLGVTKDVSPVVTKLPLVGEVDPVPVHYAMEA